MSNNLKQDQNLNEFEITPNFAYVVDPITAEEMGAFKEEAIFFVDIEEAIEDDI